MSCRPPRGGLPARLAAAAVRRHLDREESELLPESLFRLTPARWRELGRQWSACIAGWRLDAAHPVGGPRPGTREALHRALSPLSPGWG